MMPWGESPADLLFGGNFASVAVGGSPSWLTEEIMSRNRTGAYYAIAECG